MAAIEIHEIEQTSPSEWHVEVRCGSYAEKTTIHDPSQELPEGANDRFRWLLESHSTLYPYERQKAAAISREIVQYGKSLVTQLQVMPMRMLQLMARLTCIEPQKTDVSIRQEYVIIDVIDLGPQSSIHRLHWEALENLSSWESSISAAYPILVRRKVSTANIHRPEPPIHLHSAAVEKKRTYNILLVSSRLNQNDDIEPLLGGQCIVDALQRIPEYNSCNVKLEVSRPGTWTAFENHLERRSDQWAQNAGAGPWFDLVHFDVHGLIEDNGAYLLFQTTSSDKSFAKSARQVARLLQRHGITSSILTSCESANVTGSSKSNLARTFVQHGVHCTLAMSFKFSGSAAKEFVTKFYNTFLRDDERSMEKAVKVARNQLASNRIRNGNFGLRVQLDDYLIPVYYTDGLFTPPNAKDWDSSLPSKLDDPDVMDILTSFQGGNRGPIEQPKLDSTLLAMPAMRRIMQNIETEDFRTKHCPHWTGRGNDILNVESMILETPGENVFSIYGMVGVGKTTLVTFLSLWWGYTELIWTTLQFSLMGPAARRHVESRGSSAVPEGKTTLEWLLGRSSPEKDECIENLRKQRSLLVFDDIDFVTHPSSLADFHLSPEQKRNFKDSIDRLRGGRCIVMLLSTRQEWWLGLKHHACYQLQGLPYYHCTLVISKLMKEWGIHEKFADKESTKYLGQLIVRLGFNPQSLSTFLKSLTSTETGSPKTPKDLFEKIQRDAVPLDFKNNFAVRRCHVFVQCLLERSENDAKMLFLLSALQTYVREDFFRCAGEWALIPFSEEDLREYFFKYIAGSGWVAQRENPRKGLMEEFRSFKIDAILTNFLRMRVGAIKVGTVVSGIELSMWMLAKVAVMNYAGARVKVWTRPGGHKLLFQELPREISNIVAALDYCMEGIRGPGGYENVAPCLKLLSPLWVYSVIANNAEISSEMMRMRLERYTDDIGAAFNGVRNIPADTLEPYLEVLQHLTEYYLHSNTMKARRFNELARQAIDISRSQGRQLTPRSLMHHANMLIDAAYISIESNREHDEAVRLLNESISIEVGPEADLRDQLLLKCSKSRAYSVFRTLNLQTRAGFPDEHSHQAIQAEEEAFSIAGKISPGMAMAVDITDKVGYRSTIPYLTKAVELEEKGLVKEARDPLLRGLGKAILTGDAIAEMCYQMVLADLSTKDSDWETAAQHIRRYMELTQEVPGGKLPPITKSYKVDMHRNFGKLFCRLGSGEEALQHFVIVQDALGEAFWRSVDLAGLSPLWRALVLVWLWRDL